MSGTDGVGSPFRGESWGAAENRRTPARRPWSGALSVVRGTAQPKKKMAHGDPAPRRRCRSRPVVGLVERDRSSGLNGITTPCASPYGGPHGVEARSGIVEFSVLRPNVGLQTYSTLRIQWSCKAEANCWILSSLMSTCMERPRVDAFRLSHAIWPTAEEGRLIGYDGNTGTLALAGQAAPRHPGRSALGSQMLWREARRRSQQQRACSCSTSIH